MVVVATENGIDIHCDESGKFSAYAYGQNCEDRSLGKVKKWTATVVPSVALLQVDENRCGGKCGLHIVGNVATLERDRNGTLYGEGPTNPVSRGRYTYAPTYRNLYEPNEAAMARIKELNARRDQWENELCERYDAAFAEIKATLVPITEERFAQLKEEAIRGAKAGKSDG